MIPTIIKSNFNIFFIIICLISLISISGCQQLNADDTVLNESSQTTTTPTETQKTPDNNQPIANNTQNIMKLPELKGKAIVVMKVKGKPITIEVDGDNAPITAGNFVDLVKKGVYNGLVFHRVVKQPQPFVAQGGDPQGKDPKVPVARLGTGNYVDPATNSPRYIPLEIMTEGSSEPIYGETTKKAPVLKHEYGVIAMARSQMPDSASSQFYFTLADLPFLDGSYAVFGKVTDGMDVVEAIEQGDRIDSAEVISGLDNLK